MKKAIFVFAACPLLAAACAGDSHAERVRDARMEQAEEQKDSRTSAIENRNDAREERTDDAYGRRDDRIDAKEQPGDDSAKDLNELSKDRAEYKLDTQERLDKLAVRIQELDKKLKVQGTHAPTSLSGELQTAKNQHALIKNECSQLDAATTDQWEPLKSRIDRDTSDLDKRLSEMSEKIDDLE